MLHPTLSAIPLDTTPLHRKAVKPSPAARVSVAKVQPSYDEDPVTIAKLRKHQLFAVAALVKGVLCKFDAIVGDSSCQVRAVAALHLVDVLRGSVSDIEWNKGIVLANGFLVAHKSDKSDTKVKTVAEARDCDRSAKCDALVDHIRRILGEDDFELLGLITDEFGIPFRYRSNNQWGQHDKSLRARLAELSTARFVAIAKSLGSEGPTLAKAFVVTRSVIKTDGAPGTPVLAIHPTFSTASAFAFHYNMPIVIDLVRIQMHRGERPGASDLQPRCCHSCPLLA
ncbi:hypothetical protein B0T14DRAFT_565167 [Immersiella caudata]|uniref:Uncharacterized protein n=1 Tax=Immersiella caudata TaxID=314043 RepID=A0AA39WZ27_9PEZI|nr:hypothetical protein B0T14DRAFT_565167 [Immersiella caudata]